MAVRMLTVPETADHLGCSTDHVYDLINARRIAVVDIGLRRSQTRISEDDLAAYVAANTTKARKTA